MNMKEAYYFSHDSNASSDEKILNLRADLGWEGYGIYWAIIERLRDSTDYRYNINSIKGLAVSLNTKPIIVQQIINDYDLFEKDGEYFWSPSLNRRMELVEEKREQNRVKGVKSGIVRGMKMNNSSTTVEPQLNNGSTMVQNGLNQNRTEVEQGNEKKGNEKKGKEMKRKEILDTHTIAREAKIEILKIFEKKGLDLAGGEEEFEKFCAFFDQRDWITADGVRVRDPVALARTWTIKQNKINNNTNQNSNGRATEIRGTGGRQQRDSAAIIAAADAIIERGFGKG